MYEALFGLREKPFAPVPDPDFLYLSPTHRQGLNMLEYGLLGEAAFVVITGEVGSGKTTLVRRFLTMVGPEISVGLITNTHESLGSLLKWVLLSFGLSFASKDPIELYDGFVKFLQMQVVDNRRTLLIVDEAQNLAPTVLEELRMLTNLNQSKELIFQIVLVGQPELLTKLNRPELRQLAQRVSVDFRLTPLSLKDTYGYIRFRLRTAGGSPEIFTREACACIYLATEGIPRLINILCNASLVYAYGEDNRIVDIDTVMDVIGDRHTGLQVFPALKDPLRQASLREESLALLVAEPLPTNPAKLKKLDNPDPEFGEEELARSKALHAHIAFSTKPPIASARDPVQFVQHNAEQAISSENLLETSALAAETDVVEIIENNASADASLARRVFGILSTVALVITFIVAGSLLWPKVSNTAFEIISGFFGDLNFEVSVNDNSVNDQEPLTDEVDHGGTPAIPQVTETSSDLQNGQNGELESTASVLPLIYEADASLPFVEVLAARQREEAALESAIFALFDRWHLDYAGLPGATICRKARSRGLACSEEVGDWESIRAQDLPVLIGLRSEDASKSVYAVLVGLDDETARLDFGGQIFSAPIGEVDATWDGTYLLLYQLPIDFRGVLYPGNRGQEVVNLRMLLGGYYNDDFGRDSLFDAGLEHLVRQFQIEHDLWVDGVAGPETFSQLKTLLEARDQPSLSNNSQSGDS